MSQDGSLPRGELERAIREISHQLDLLRSGPTLGEPSDDRGLITELEAELAAAKQRLAEAS